MKNDSRGVETKRLALVHNCLIACLCLDNASRTGAIANMTCGESKIAKNEGGTFMVNIFNHKTVVKSGPKTMYFSNTLFKEANIYFHEFRNKLDEATALEMEPFFVSYTMQRYVGRKSTQNELHDDQKVSHVLQKHMKPNQIWHKISLIQCTILKKQQNDHITCKKNQKLQHAQADSYISFLGEIIHKLRRNYTRKFKSISLKKYQKERLH